MCSSHITPTVEGALPPYPLRYPRGSRATDIALTGSVPLSAGRVETRLVEGALLQVEEIASKPHGVKTTVEETI